MLVTLLAVFLLQLAWIFVQGPSDTSFYADSKIILQYGEEIATGTFASFDAQVDGLTIAEMKGATLYLTRCPYQSGIVLFSAGLFSLFGDWAPTVFQIINALANCVTIVAFYKIGEMYFEGRSRGVSLLFLVLVLFIPNLLYCSFMYGNQLGFCLIMVATHLYVASMRETRLRKSLVLFVGAGLVSTVAIWIKSTFKIILVALCIVWIINLLLKRSKAALVKTLIFLCSVAFAFACTAIPQHAMEGMLGYSLGKGEPTTSQIKMGLENEAVLGKTMPGWYAVNEADTWIKLNNDYEATAEAFSQGIASNVNTFIQDPAYALWFFATKLGTEWLVPDFGAYYFAGINAQFVDETETEALAFNPSTDRSYNYEDSFIVRNTGRLMRFIWPFIDAYQSLIYVFATIGCLKLFKRRKELDASWVLLPCLFIVGWAVYVLWEAQAQYAMPFFMMLIPVAGYGICMVFAKESCITSCKNDGLGNTHVNLRAA